MIWHLLVTAAAAGVLAAYGYLPLAVLGIGVVLLVVLVLLRPVTAAYVWLAVTPLVVGIDRGRILPLLRPNEALLLALAGVVVGRWSLLFATGRARTPKVTRVDVGFSLLALTGSVLPLLWLVARGHAVAVDDLLSVSLVFKYYLLFIVVRLTVSTEAQVRRCLWTVMASAAVVAVLAVLQSLDVLGVPSLLQTYWAPEAGRLARGRGSSTIGNPHGTADVMIFSLSIALALVLERGRSYRRPALRALAAVFLLGTLGSGQASGIIGLVVGVLALGVVLRQLPRLFAWFVAAAPLATALLIPVVSLRLAAVDHRTGVPSSWSARLDNLSTYFWPRLFSENGWVLGVQPVPQAAGKESWQTTVYIESGHTWLLWIGGVPYLVAFFAFLWLGLRTAGRAARLPGADGAAGAAAFVALWVVAILTLFDAHLFLRGSADLSIPLLALATGALLRHRPLNDTGMQAASRPRRHSSLPRGDGRATSGIEPEAGGSDESGRAHSPRDDQPLGPRAEQAAAG